MDQALADRTLERASRALKSGNGSCLPELVKLLKALSSNIQEVQVSELADLIEKDAMVLAKVLAVANTMGYNGNRVQVTSLSQAIHVIGFERIRVLSMSLLIAEQVARNSSPDEQREATALALTSGFLAQAATERYPLIDGEEAFICASLRNFGRLIMATFMTDDYRRAKRVGRLENDDSYRRVFGLTPLELGRELLRAENLPDPILRAMRDCKPASFNNLDISPDDQLLALCDFSGKLAEIVIAPSVSEKEFVERTRALAADYSTLMPGLAQTIESLLKSAKTDMTDFVRDHNLTGFPTGSLVRMSQRALTIAKSATALAEASATKAKDMATSSTSAAAKAVAPQSNAKAWTAGIEHLSSLINGKSVSRATIFGELLQIVQNGVHAPECLLFCADADGVWYSLNYGRGNSIHALQHRAKVRADERTVMGVCLKQKENVLVHNSSDPKISAYIPQWMQRPPLFGAFALLPMVGTRGVHGLILAGWSTPQQIEIPPQDAKLVLSLLSLVGKFCER